LSIGVLLERLKLLRNLNVILSCRDEPLSARYFLKSSGWDRFFEEYTSLEDAIESFDDDWEADGTSQLNVFTHVSVMVGR